MDIDTTISAEDLRYAGEQQQSSRRRKAGHIIGMVEPYLGDRPIRRVLSVGSGFCFIEERIKHELFPDAEMICTDADEPRLHSFVQPSLNKWHTCATELPFDNESFDFILAHQVLEHINDYPAVLEQMARLCKKGGMMYINVPNPHSPAVGTLPDGTWPAFLPWAFLKHNLDKLRPDFMTNTEKYHTGFTRRMLEGFLPGFRIIDLRKDRLRQALPDWIPDALIRIFPRNLLFLFIESNIWLCIKEKTS